MREKNFTELLQLEENLYEKLSPRKLLRNLRSNSQSSKSLSDSNPVLKRKIFETIKFWKFKEHKDNLTGNEKIYFFSNYVIMLEHLAVRRDIRSCVSSQMRAPFESVFQAEKFREKLEF